MGFLREKYTREYFTQIAGDGTRLPYGALGADEWREGGIFKEIREPIDLLDLRGGRVLELGFGRGESARYLLKKREAAYYVGVDFSEPAFLLAKETLQDVDKNLFELHCGDALDFLRSRKYRNHFDAVFMLDVIEHIPTREVSQLLPLIFGALRPRAYLVVDTPFYAIDEDFIAQGHTYIDPSATDIFPETRGMHCNKFTRERLLREMEEAGFGIMNDKQFRKPAHPRWRRFVRSLKRAFS